jgi:hypothetical protein
MEEEVEKFNDKFPSYELTDRTINKSLATKEKARDNSIAFNDFIGFDILFEW